MAKWSKDYEIKKNKSGDLWNKNALIHLARLIGNPDSFADNLMTNIFRLKFNNLAPFEKTGFVTSWSKECHVMLRMNFQNYFSEICLIISLWNPLLGSFWVKDLCIFCRGSFYPFNPCLNLPENKIPLLQVTTLQANVKLEGSGKRGWEEGILGRLLL